jgi:transcriptional regulator with XRE-family HTH domain
MKKSTLRERVANEIRTILKEKQWTQQDLANASGYGKSYISEILAGKINLTLDTVGILEDALKTPILKFPEKQTPVQRTGAV